MNDVLKKIGLLGIVPVVKIEDAKNALSLGKALLEGGLPIAEITFRTEEAEESIKILTDKVPGLLVGAGTVLTVEQVKRAVGAGASFIVSPGFNAKVVRYCLDKGIPVTPGINSPTQIEMALEMGLEILKFFPAEASGGLSLLKAMSAPYGGVKFIPTGGINASNLNTYLSFAKVHACGGSWMVKADMISEGRFDEIKKLVSEAVATMLGFDFAHLGINTDSEEDARKFSLVLGRAFDLPIKEGTSSIFAGTGIEITKKRFPGSHGHIAIKTNYIERAIYYLEKRGIKVIEDTRKLKNGKLIAVYLDLDINGFAVHLLQKS